MRIAKKKYQGRFFLSNLESNTAAANDTAAWPEGNEYSSPQPRESMSRALYGRSLIKKFLIRPFRTAVKASAVIINKKNRTVFVCFPLNVAKAAGIPHKKTDPPGADIKDKNHSGKGRLRGINPAKKRVAPVSI